MTDAPERIWADTYSGKKGAGYWHTVNDVLGGCEYIRADMLPKVKPLQWHERTEGLWRSDDPTGGIYEVIELSESRAACHHLVRGYGVNIGITHQSVDDAKLASQAHYESRILAALVQP